MKKLKWKTVEDIIGELLPPVEEPLILDDFLAIRQTAILTCRMFCPKWYDKAVLRNLESENDYLRGLISNPTA